MSNLKKIRVQHVDRDAKGVEIKTDVDVITDADCIMMDDGDLRSGVKKMIDDRIGEVIDGAPEELDTLKEIATELEKNQSGVSTIIKAMNDKLDKRSIVNVYRVNGGNTVPSSKALFDMLKALNKDLAKKVDKVEGKGLSSNDFTNEYKNKIDTIEAGNVDLSGYVKTTDIVDFKRCIVLSESNYSALSDAEKNRADTLYFLL